MSNPRLKSALAATIVGLVANLLPALVCAQSAITPPTILEAVEPEYPESAVSAERGRVVATLRVVIESDGVVSEATMVDSLGDGLDEAAIATMRRFLFTPAMRDGLPIRIAIRFELAMAPPEPEPEPEAEPEAEPEPPPIPPGRIVGQLLESSTGEPLEDVDVAYVDESGAEHWTRTNAEGRFAFEGLAPGPVRIIARPLGLPERVEQEVVTAGEELALTYRLITEEVAAAEPDVATARAIVDPPPREITRRTLPREVLNSIPGTRGDPLRAIEILPGIARPPFGVGLLIIRGSAPGDSEYLLGGVPIPSIYHFGGLTSVINGRLLERIDFFPGNYSSRYGRKMGGIVEIETRDPATDGFHGNVEASVIDTSVLFEGPITPRFSIAGSFRRSLIDLVLNAVLSNADVNVTAAPVYYDYQLFATWRPTERDRVRFRFYGSDDRFRLILGAGVSDDPAVRGGFGIANHFDHFQTNWERQIDTRIKQESVLLFGPTRLAFNVGSVARLELRLQPVYLRNEWTVNVNERLRVIAGTDISLGGFQITYTGGRLGQSEGSPTQGSGGIDDVSVRESGFVVRPGVYLEASYTAGRFVLTSALRFDYYSEIRNWSLDPRVVANYQLTPTIRLKAAVGLYSQPPEFNESSPGLGTATLNPLHSAHFGTGIEWNPSPGIQLGLDGFYKQLWNRVVSTVNAVDPRYENAGVGRIYGMELSGRIQPSPSRPYFGYVSYTLMRSERRDHPNDPYRLFDFDQTHIFTASFSYTWARHHWQLGGTLRLVSGNPYTPINQGVMDVQTLTQNPIPGLTNSARNALFNRVDVRVEKQWWFQSWKLALFLDVQNAYNQHNPEARQYNYDYTLSGTISGLPIIPGLGIRGEF